MKIARFRVAGMLGLALANMLVSLETFGECNKSDSKSAKRQPETHCFLQRVLSNVCNFQDFNSNMADALFAKLHVCEKSVFR